MTGWLIYDQKQYNKNRWFADELIKYCSSFCDMELIIVNELKIQIANNELIFVLRDRTLLIPDFAICRTIFPLLSYAMEKKGIRVFNRYLISCICNDKCYAYSLVSKSDLPIMDTVFYGKMSKSTTKKTDFDFPFIVKSTDGHGGEEVFWIDNCFEFNRALEKISSHNYIVQKICNTTGRDLRVYILGGKIFYSVIRLSSEFRSNYSLGAEAVKFELKSSEERMVYNIVDLLPVLPDFIGIDFLYDNGNLIFNEIEDVVGTRMIYNTSTINVAKKFAYYIKSVMEKSNI